MHRRGFLRRGLLGSAVVLVTVGGGLALRPGRRAPAPPRELAALSDGAFPVLVAVAARVLAGTSAVPVQIALRVDDALRAAPRETRKDLDTALRLLDNALPGLLLRGTPTPFTLQSEDAQHRALLAWRDSRLVLLRSAYNGLRKLCLAAHYATPDGWPDTGYSGPSIPKPAPPPITARGPLAALEQAAQPAAAETQTAPLHPVGAP